MDSVNKNLGVKPHAFSDEIRYKNASEATSEELYRTYGSSPEGLSDEETINESRERYGRNVVIKSKKRNAFLALLFVVC